MSKVLSTLAYPFLKLASGIYGFGQSLDRKVKEKKKTKLNQPVISIGNITVGGTGKTPLLLRLCRDLKKLDVQPAILSRGYPGMGEKNIINRLVHGSQSKSHSLSDEVIMMNNHFPEIPIGVGPDRVSHAKKIHKRFNPDCFILDDGFQHWKLDRDLDIVCIDATDPYGKGHLLPLGRLREPLMGLHRADLIVLTRTDLISTTELEKLKTNLKIHYQRRVLLIAQFKYKLVDWKGREVDIRNTLKNKTVVAASGIGNPGAYEHVLKSFGTNVMPIRFKDHHMYVGKDLAKIEEKALNETAIVVVTEKDKVKLMKLRWGKNKTNSVRVFVLNMEVVFSNKDEKAWLQSLKQTLSK